MGLLMYRESKADCTRIAAKADPTASGRSCIRRAGRRRHGSSSPYARRHSDEGRRLTGTALDTMGNVVNLATLPRRPPLLVVHPPGYRPIYEPEPEPEIANERRLATRHGRSTREDTETWDPSLFDEIQDPLRDETPSDEDFDARDRDLFSPGAHSAHSITNLEIARQRAPGLSVRGGYSIEGPRILYEGRPQPARVAAAGLALRNDISALWAREFAPGPSQERGPMMYPVFNNHEHSHGSWSRPLLPRVSPTPPPNHEYRPASNTRRRLPRDEPGRASGEAVAPRLTIYNSDGLGDRHRSLSPEESAWDTLLSTIPPDERLPSASSSFASASGTASTAPASQGSRSTPGSGRSSTHSSATSLNRSASTTPGHIQGDYVCDDAADSVPPFTRERAQLLPRPGTPLERTQGMRYANWSNASTSDVQNAGSQIRMMNYANWSNSSAAASDNPRIRYP